MHGAASATGARVRRAASGQKKTNAYRTFNQEGKQGRAVNLQTAPRRSPTRPHHRVWWETESPEGTSGDSGTTREQGGPNSGSRGGRQSRQRKPLRILEPHVNRAVQVQAANVIGDRLGRQRGSSEDSRTTPAERSKYRLQKECRVDNRQTTHEQSRLAD